MNRITFPIAPVAKARARVTRSGHAYTPKKTNDFEAAIKKHWRTTVQRPFAKSYLVNLIFFFKRPKSHGKKKLRHTSRPDLDNLTKGVLDALNGLAWRDDSQIVELMASKHYGDVAEIRMEWTELDV